MNFRKRGLFVPNQSSMYYPCKEWIKQSHEKFPILHQIDYCLIPPPLFIVICEGTCGCTLIHGWSLEYGGTLIDVVKMVSSHVVLLVSAAHAIFKASMYVLHGFLHFHVLNNVYRILCIIQYYNSFRYSDELIFFFIITYTGYVRSSTHWIDWL